MQLAVKTSRTVSGSRAGTWRAKARAVTDSNGWRSKQLLPMSNVVETINHYSDDASKGSLSSERLWGFPLCKVLSDWEGPIRSFLGKGDQSAPSV